MESVLERSRRTVVDTVPGVPSSPLHAPSAVLFDGWAFVSGILAADYATGLAEQARLPAGLPFHVSPATVQSECVYEHLVRTLEACGAALEDVVVIHQFFPHKRYFEPYRQVGRRYWGTDRPPSTALPCGSLAVPGAVVEVDVTATVPSAGRHRAPVATSKSPQVLGSYSQGLSAGDWVVLAGATPADHTRTSAAYPGAIGTAIAPSARVDPNLWYGSEIQKQVEYIMFEKQQPVLDAAGSSLDRVVKADVYLSNMEEDLAGFQQAWRTVFPDNPPATTILPVDGFGSAGSRLEIGLIALTNASPLRVEPVTAPGALPTLGHHPHAVRAGDLLFLSTVMAADERGLAARAKPNPGLPGAGNQAHLEMETCLESAAAICAAGGTSLDMMLKRRNFYLDLSDLFATEFAVRDAWPSAPPASSNIGMTGPLSVPACRLAMDMVCAIPTSELEERPC